MQGKAGKDSNKQINTLALTSYKLRININAFKKMKGSGMAIILKGIDWRLTSPCMDYFQCIFRQIIHITM